MLSRLYIRYEAKLEEEKQKTQIILKPLNTELMEITEQVNEQLERVSSLKASIARKEEIVLQNLKQIVSSWAFDNCNAKNAFDWDTMIQL